MVCEDSWMMRVLTEAEKLNLPDWMVGAGFLRNKVWDYLHGISRDIGDTNDIDLVYFDAENVEEEKDWKLSDEMTEKFGFTWEIKNQAYMHTRHGDEPYSSTEEALSKWVETPTCVAVTLKQGKVRIVAPHGIDDLVNLIVRPSPACTSGLKYFHKRIQDKKWLEKWPKLQVFTE